jgi:exopolysaccharide production protein ExoY
MSNTKNLTMDNSMNAGYKMVFEDPTGESNSSKAGAAKTSLIVKFLDILISTLAIIFLSPALICVAILVYAQDRGPVIFRQPRIGLNGKFFYCLKFRSMRTDSAQILERILRTDPVLREEWESTQKFRHDPRITKVGHFIRKTSLDELPQLLNVLRGEMSLVGPRPIVQSEIEKYGRSFKAYTSVLPGITGLWQVSGRSNINYRRRVALDRMFAKKTSLGLYLGILIKTIPAVLLQKGSY